MKVEGESANLKRMRDRGTREKFNHISSEKAVLQAIPSKQSKVFRMRVAKAERSLLSARP